MYMHTMFKLNIVRTDDQSNNYQEQPGSIADSSQHLHRILSGIL